MITLENGIDILGSVGSNAQNLELLLKHLDRLVPFVGAGLSAEFGYPSWNGLLQELADQAGTRPQVDAYLAAHQFEEAAEAVEKALPPNLFDDKLRLTFDHERLPRPLGKGAVQHVARIARGLVLTTNFDRVLEAAFEDAGHGFGEVFSGSRIYETSRAIQLGGSYLLKLHGDYNDATSRVLTLTEYARQYGNPNPEKVDLSLPLPAVLHQALGAWPLLFLGCSLNNDRTTRVIAQIARRLTGTIHFALLPDSDNTADRREQLYTWNIRPLFFPAGQYEKVDEFLHLLADTIGRMPQGDSPVIVADVLDAKTHTLPELMTALLAAVREPRGSITLTPAQVTEIVRRHKPRDLTEYRLARIAEWSQPRYQIDRRFVNLTLLLDQGEDAQGTRWAAPESRFNDLRDVLKSRTGDPVLVLLGVPGSGKSTLLRRFQLDTAIDTLCSGQDEDVVTFFLPLNAYRLDSGHPRDWVNTEWRRLYPDLPRLDNLLAQGKMLLLLDAINEMPHAAGEGKRYDERVRLWRDFIQSITRQGNRALFSCRSLDYSAGLSSKELPVPQVVVQPMDDAQVQAFLRAYLPSGAEVTWQELLGTRQLGLYRNPYFLKLLCNQVETHGAVPQGRASLFTGFVREALRREIDGENPLFRPDHLLTHQDQQKLARRQWHNPYALPEGGNLIGRISRLAYAMQKIGLETEGTQVRTVYDQACRLLGEDLGKDCQEEILKAGVALNLLDQDLAQDEIFFFHQLLQEFLAARRLAAEPKPELVRVEWQVNKVSPTLEMTLASLADSDPLPLLPQTGWEETTLLASAMASDPARFIKDLMEVNLPLAGRCMASLETSPAEDPKRHVQQALIDRTQDSSADLRARIAAGLALGHLGDPRFLLRTGPHGSYLLPPLKTIPAGKYPIGSDEGIYDSEAPAHRVRLEEFQISEFPVTNAEYGLFIAAGGYEDERWWLTEEAKAWRSGERTSEAPKQRWRNDRKTLQGMSEEHIKNLVKQGSITSRYAETCIIIRNWTGERFEAWLEERYPAGKRSTEPRKWNDESFNNPGQPVVGVCWYEACAYCAWLSEQTRRIYRLPSELEYEAAARGYSGRKYAYGKEFDSTSSNTFESHIRRTTPVGIFRNATPEGVLDLSGNVYTWTTSVYEPYPYQGSDGQEEVDRAEQPLVIRGGSWFGDQRLARAVYRDCLDPSNYNYSIGFRLVGLSILPSSATVISGPSDL